MKSIILLRDKRRYLLMRLRYSLCATALMIFFLGYCGLAQAGQIVNAPMRQWAKQAIAQEAKLDLKSDNNTVAVLYFHNQTGNPDLDPLQKGLALLLITDLGKIDAIRVVERVQLQALVEELNLGASGLVSSDSAPRAGRLLGAGFLVGGAFSGDGAVGLNIDSDLLQVADQRQVGGTSSRGQLDDLLRMEKQILFELARLLKLALTPEQKNLLNQPITHNIEALMFFFRGVDEADKGNFKKAARQYEKAKEMDPGFSMPVDALRELTTLGLIGVDKRSRSMVHKLRKRVSDNDQPIPEGAGRRDRSGAIIRQPQPDSGTRTNPALN